MKILPQYSGLRFDCASLTTGADEAVVGLEASLRSSESLRAILECAKTRCSSHAFDTERLRMIEELCRTYEAHHKAVRDHCLDYYNTDPEGRVQPVLRKRTGDLVLKGRALYTQLREAILATY